MTLSEVSRDPNRSTPDPRRSPARRALGVLSVRRISAVYLLVVIIVVFSFWAPDTFPETATIKQVLNANAVIGLAALGLCIPLAAGVFDLSFAFTMSLSGVIAARFVLNGHPIWLGVLAGLGAAFVVGAINAFVVLVLRVDSLIATLGTGSIIQAFITYVTDGNTVQGTKLTKSFTQIGQHNVAGVTLPVVYMLVAAVAVWYVFEHTPLGRKLYATGFNPTAAKIAKVRTRKLQAWALIVCALVAGWAGIALASVSASGSPDAGTPYLLPAFAAAFLGATQIKSGRFNAWGTVIAVLTLGTGTTGLALAATPQWAANLFIGVVLISALAVTVAEGNRVARN